MSYTSLDSSLPLVVFDRPIHEILQPVELLLGKVDQAELPAGGLQKRWWGSAEAPHVAALTEVGQVTFAHIARRGYLAFRISCFWEPRFGPIMTQSWRKYRYERLNTGRDEIRLLTLLPDPDENGLVCCAMVTFDLTTAPKFQALSYDWGPPDRTWTIFVDGRAMTIRQNLWLFLDMFRTEERNKGFLWIDQICIDQQDNTERGHQVKLMGRIYSKAVRTLVWLGSPIGVDTAISEALIRHGQLLTDIEVLEKGTLRGDHVARQGARKRRVRAEFLCIDGNCAICNSMFRRRISTWPEQQDVGAWISSISANNVQGSPELASDLEDLCGLNYWRRLWIIQENVLAEECIFFLGNQQYSRSNIDRYSLLQRHLGEVNLPLPSQVSALTDLVAPVSNLTLDQAILRFSKGFLACSDSHDVVYGLLGLVSPPHRIPVDYQSTLPEVYELLMNAILLSPTLVDTLGETEPFQLCLRLEDIGERLGLTPLWSRWVAPLHRNESLAVKLDGFLRCLGYLEQMGLRKQRWTAYELGSIVHTAQQIQHTLLPEYAYHDGNPEIDSGSIPECTIFVEAVNCMTRPGLMHLLSKMVSSARKREAGDRFASWFYVFRYNGLPNVEQDFRAHRHD